MCNKSDLAPKAGKAGDVIHHLLGRFAALFSKPIRKGWDILDDWWKIGGRLVEDWWKIGGRLVAGGWQHVKMICVPTISTLFN